MKFWDSSAIVPLLVNDTATARLQKLALADAAMFVWWGTEVECASAISRLEREGALDAQAAGDAFDRLRDLSGAWHEIEPVDEVRETAVRFLRVHPLRATDALQLAAAFIAGERRPPSLEIMTLDERLAAAARKEGFVLR